MPTAHLDTAPERGSAARSSFAQPTAHHSPSGPQPLVTRHKSLITSKSGAGCAPCQSKSSKMAESFSALDTQSFRCIMSPVLNAAFKAVAEYGRRKLRLIALRRKLTPQTEGQPFCLSSSLPGSIPHQGYSTLFRDNAPHDLRPNSPVVHPPSSVPSFRFPAFRFAPLRPRTDFPGYSTLIPGYSGLPGYSEILPASRPPLRIGRAGRPCHR